ncbi:hypothetical protein [Enterococcus faecalis]|uniref:hypothetical protein n=1 Tax=Enterococcus faecalis TaxID=1351 RepID=UPI0018E125C1|nr:hypothetical protein [Enterococcus faecalis]EHS2295565.1 hypothetical protein [Enterococcus faecalis]MBI0605322.1 hypothetical protein [Enterococcus faecalis]HAP4227499.1 hypothetical protein [Enterococcus faecalis]
MKEANQKQDMLVGMAFEELSEEEMELTQGGKKNTWGWLTVGYQISNVITSGMDQGYNKPR